MARERMVTRTFEVTTIELLTVNTDTAEVRKLELPITGFSAQRKPLEYLKELYETDTVKVVTYKELSTSQALYGMTEQDFLAHAALLPPRTSEKSADEFSEN